MDDDKLIFLVQEHPMLYDVQHPQYLSQPKRETIWEEIGVQLGQSGQTCKERWNRIRENFRKALNLRKSRNSGAPNYRPPKYDKELDFLRPHIGIEEKQANPMFVEVDSDKSLDNIKCSNSISGSPEGDSQFSDGSFLVPLKHSQSSIMYNTYRSRSPNDHLTAESPMITECVPNAQENHLNAESDPLIDFFSTMAKTVKGFPIKKQLEIKAKLFQIVHSVEIELIDKNS